jgi:hypothetical protein
MTGNGGGQGSAESGVAFGKEVQHSIDVGSIANVTEFEFEIEIFLDALNLQGERGSIGKMVDNGTYSG